MKRTSVMVGMVLAASMALPAITRADEVSDLKKQAVEATGVSGAQKRAGDAVDKGLGAALKAKKKIDAQKAKSSTNGSTKAAAVQKLNQLKASGKAQLNGNTQKAQKVQELKAAGKAQLNMKAQKVQELKAKASELTAPQAAPSIKAPEVKAPEVKVPAVKAPELPKKVELPKANLQNPFKKH